ncbi:glycoside hydrolase family 79 protein [Lepidopterella palustris CBS 459.81]|uniref:Glycoside hydrolase family 79 protein n=1 Tax=Lepidopterella palustris CBS 459.81 TaxID=1314670 RepID=A0A8E2EAD8_9PEZI|nr:glycoside hydrolase family 79 protein [Lepidopterella palustris CBS 459.81]
MSLFQPLLFITAALSTVVSAQKPTFADGTSLASPVPRPTDLNAISVSATPSNSGGAIPESFVSYSIEFAFFPDFAGNSSQPNDFSNNLLESVREYMGTKPYIRVGGNTQDYALYDASLDVATNGIYIPSISTDYPVILSIGPSFFESYSTWPDTKFIHGFNLAKNTTAARESLLTTVPLACKALSDGKLLYWELGNEPDLYKTSAQGHTRPPSWDESDFVTEWKNGTAAIKDTMANACPDMVSASMFQWIAPSFAGTSNSLNPITTWKDGLDTASDIVLFSSHNYIGSATQPGITLQGTLMNHTSTVTSVSKQNAEANALATAGMTIPFILGETNSLSNEGTPGLSNVFGAALWGVDLSLYCAATGIKRVHMHQGTNYRYQSWQPIETDKTSMGTKAPFYGNVAVAASLGDLTAGGVEVQHIPMSKETEAVYAIYANNTLARVMVINMMEYNYTAESTNTRPHVAYNFTVPTSCAGNGIVQRLLANGSDAITGITFNGRSYNYEVAQGKAHIMGNVTKDEIVWVGKDGIFSVNVPWSSAALVQLSC